MDNKRVEMITGNKKFKIEGIVNFNDWHKLHFIYFSYPCCYVPGLFSYPKEHSDMIHLESHDWEQ